MKYLDEDIIFTINTTISASSVYKYELYNADNTLLFVGNTFVTAQTTSVTIDCTDIIVNQRWDGELTDGVSKKVSLVDKYRVKFYKTSSSTVYSNYEYVCLTYRYPNKKEILNKPSLWDWDTTGVGSYNNMVQGCMGSSFALTPRVPLINTDEYKFPMSIFLGSNLTGRIWGITTRGDFFSGGKVFNLQAPTSNISIPLSNLFGTIGEKQQHYSYSTELPPWHSSIERIDDNIFYVNKWQFINPPTTLYAVCSDTLDGEWISGFITTDGRSQTMGCILRENTLYINFLDESFEDVEECWIKVTIEDLPDNCGSLIINMTIMDEGEDEGYWIEINDIYSGFGSGTPQLVYAPIQYLHTAPDLAADIDMCPAKYYLLWQDRLGGFQSQPFDKTEKFSEEFERTNYKDYKNRYRLSSVQVHPKWNINSGWIDEKLYPFYESIFVSPYLLLYDTKEDKSYRVYVENSEYEEKTFKNQGRQMFNLNLELKEDKKQKIIF